MPSASLTCAAKGICGVLLQSPTPPTFEDKSAGRVEECGSERRWTTTDVAVMVCNPSNKEDR